MCMCTCVFVFFQSSFSVIEIKFFFSLTSWKPEESFGFVIGIFEFEINVVNVLFIGKRFIDDIGFDLFFVKFFLFKIFFIDVTIFGGVNVDVVDDNENDTDDFLNRSIIIILSSIVATLIDGFFVLEKLPPPPPLPPLPSLAIKAAAAAVTISEAFKTFISMKAFWISRCRR